jgi:hypothetical protein
VRCSNVNRFDTGILHNGCSIFDFGFEYAVVVYYLVRPITVINLYILYSVVYCALFNSEPIKEAKNTVYDCVNVCLYTP